jgi:acyl-CoA thioester hydrolase
VSGVESSAERMQPPRVPASSAMRFRARLSTRWSDEDNQQVLNNAVYLTLFEETRYRYFRELLGSNHFPFLLAQCNVAFLSPGRGGEDVECACATTHVGTTSFTQAYRVSELASGRVLAEGEARLVSYDPRTGAKVELPRELRAAIERRERG